MVDIPSEVALEKANFFFVSSYKLNIASRLVGRSLCTLSLLSVVLYMYFRHPTFTFSLYFDLHGSLE